MWGLRNFDQPQTCYLSGEKGSAGVGRWKTCLWKSKYSAFFSSESFLLWISSSFCHPEVWKWWKRQHSKLFPRVVFLSLTEKLLIALVPAFHALQSWLFLSEEYHKAKAPPKIRSFPQNWVDCSFPLLGTGNLPCWDCIFNDSVISVILRRVQLHFQKENVQMLCSRDWGYESVLWTLPSICITTWKLFTCHCAILLLFPKITDQEQEGASGDGYLVLTICQNRDRLPGLN